MQMHDGAAAELAALTARRAETEAFIASLADAPAGRIEILPLDVRRALVQGCYRVVVKPASKRGPGFRTEDVSLTTV